MLVVHVASRADWEAARARGHYTHPSLEEDGFVHCSRPEQVEAVVNAGDPPPDLDLVALCIDTGALDAEVKWEVGRDERGPGDPEAFPHVYGPVDLDAVVAAPAMETDGGRYVLPPEVYEVASELD